MVRWPIAVTVLLAGCGAGAGSGDDEPGGGSGSGDGCTTTDTDADGWSDEVEIVMETSPTDATDHPTARDELVFVLPYQATPRPSAHDVEADAKLSRADVAILLDTTGSMLGTTSRIQGEFAEIAAGLAAEIEDVAIGAAGYGDFPVYDGANSHVDVPFYLVHRMMTARTAAGLASITASFRYRNIFDGLGNWFSVMRGGDEPEQHWEALRQAATGAGITYPAPSGGGTRTLAPFDPATAYPAIAPAGEELGTIGGMGFRRDSTPIILQITDTNAHVGGLTTTSPVSATRPVALGALATIGARVVGVMAWITVGHDDLTAITIETGGQVAPTAWGTGADRPANCPIGKCCVVAEDEYPRPQPDPVNGLCPLVFQADRYSMNLSKMVTQAVVAIARGASFAIGAELRDDGTDDVDVHAAFLDRVEAVPDGACSGQTVADTDQDGTPDAFPAIIGGSRVCFRIVPRINDGVPGTTAARRYRGVLQLTGDGVGSFTTREVWFVVPSEACTPPVFL